MAEEEIKLCFLEYLIKEQSADNFEFLMNLQAFKEGKIKGSEIYRKYCTERSPKALFISQKTKSRLKEVFEGQGREEENVNVEVFSSAEVEMIKLVSQDSLPRFLESAEFKLLEKKYGK